jgi:DNA-directed RNA polymerase specialized sigma24 family protein
LQKKHTAEQLAESREAFIFVHDSDDPSQKILEEERVKALYSLIRKNLSPYEYRIWQLYMSGRSAKDISLVVGADEKSVGNAIYRIRKKLRALLL